MPLASHPALARALEEALAGGPIPFRRYMELALHHPEGGYYAQPRPRIGAGGDFLTSPHQSPWFGRMAARQLQAVWEALGRPAVFPVLEYGAGEGWLAHDILAHASEGPVDGGFRAALEYVPIERSAAARERLGERLAPWASGRPGGPCARLNEWPPGQWAFEGAVLAHEFLDALPVHLLLRAEEGLKELHVERRGEGLALVEGPLSDPRLEGHFARLGIELAPGQRAEACPEAGEWVRAVAAKLKRGAILVWDYGYSARVLYGHERHEGTLRGYRGHTLEPNALARPGETDLTAHVDFTSLLRAAEGAGLRLGGFTDQMHFLLGLGLAEALASAEGADAARERRAVMGLLDPGGLGSAIKVMLLAKGLEETLFPAFSMKPEDRESYATLRE
ncbi:MAG: SAM-dependent methyltransferase [Candidatus Tectomicrobia bacterium]|uniref:SAM-dependent methyltransferase n=1 Tax=Tectimicrobiota bacterium TaxID=2528274 RepID=A0A932HWN8_UNCTE|nr:SAM-dependent methyltransferase [Candidatus Tectomicrobia bacterium]